MQRLTRDFNLELKMVGEEGTIEGYARCSTLSTATKT
jgi:hypothetical protein